jgi:hypothetical protein
MGGDKLLPMISGLSAESDHGKKIVERRSEIFPDDLPENRSSVFRFAGAVSR